jgi:hypothetical protein
MIPWDCSQRNPNQTMIAPATGWMPPNMVIALATIDRHQELGIPAGLRTVLSLTHQYAYQILATDGQYLGFRFSVAGEGSYYYKLT